MRDGRDRAILVFHEKLSLDSGLVSERRMWRVPISERYPHGIKYRFVLADPMEHEVLLLFDNHWPKGPHVHRRGRELPGEFSSVEQILLDFIRESAVEEVRFHENKKDRD